MHNKDRQRTHNAWKAIKQRCYNPNHREYCRYGAVGVSMCNEWLHFEGFLKDMGPRPENSKLTRINKRLDYSKSNCRWSKQKTYKYNRRFS